MPRRAVAASLVLFFVFSAVGAESDDNELANPGFELGGASTITGWDGYGRGYAVDRDVRRSGQRSIRCVARGETDGLGAVQIIHYDNPDRRPIVVAGWCKTQDVAGGGDCSVYLDIIYADGAPWWGKTASWARGTHDWAYSARVYRPSKPVKEIRTYVFLRRTTGTAWFDDIKICRGGLHLTDICIAPDYPRRRHGLHLSAQLTQPAKWRCDLLSETGDSIDFAEGSGRDVRWMWPGQRPPFPSALRITAQTPAGHQMTFRAKVSAPAHRNPVRRGYAVWTQTAAKKVYPTENPPAIGLSLASIALARNEREGFQIAVKPADAAPLRDVRVDVGRLTSESGDVFPAEHIQCYVVGYLWVGTPSGHPMAPVLPNWCPEVLLPAKPFHVVEGRTQTVWVRVFAAEGTKPGTYRGNVTVRPANAAPADVAVHVRVRPFALPRTPRMKTAFAMMDGFTRKTYGKLTPELRRRSIDIMLDHRLNPDDISRTEPPRLADLLYARSRGMNTFNIANLVPLPKHDRPWVCYVPLSAYGPKFTQELAARLDAYIAALRKHGLSKMAYFYGFDERREDYDDLIKGICRFLKDRYPEVSTFTTAGYMYAKREKMPLDYQDYMDWYCPLTPRYKPELSRRLRSVGKQVWWYVCCGPKHPYANFASVDYPSIEGRLLAWMTWGYESDGLLFWHVNYWGANPIIDWQDPYLDWKSTCISRMTGDGCLIYPTPQGPTSSIRLENICDGVEDYDYLCLLEQARGRAAAMACFGQLVKSMKDYSRDPAALSKVRDEIARMIEASNPPE